MDFSISDQNALKRQIVSIDISAKKENPEAPAKSEKAKKEKSSSKKKKPGKKGESKIEDLADEIEENSIQE